MVRYGVGKTDRTGFTMNVSLGGTYIRTNNVFKPGTTIQLELDFPNGKYSLWAQVVWAKKVPPQLAHIVPCGMGVRFINPGEEWEKVFEEWERR